MIKKKLKIIIICLFFVQISSAVNAVPVGPIKNLIIEAVEKIPKFFDELSSGGKKADELMNNQNSKKLDELNIFKKDQEIVFSKISKKVHNNHLFDTYNKSNIEIAIKHGIRLGKKGGKKLLDLFDFDYVDREEDLRIGPHIIKSWTGKVYRFSRYFSRPKLDERLLLVCKNDKQIFYFTIILNNKNDINRAYLTHNFNIKKYYSTLSRQELLILQDNDKSKIMATKPVKPNLYPSNYFIVYSDQNFDHHKRAYDPKKLINQTQKYELKKNPMNKCYKAKKNGLVI